MSPLPFEPAPLRKVLSRDIVGQAGNGRRTFLRLECGHTIIMPVSKDTGNKTKRCKQCVGVV